MYVPESANIWISLCFRDFTGNLVSVSNPYVVIFDAFKAVVQTTSLVQVQTGVCGFTWNTAGLEGSYFLVGFGESEIGTIRSDPLICEVKKSEVLTEYVSFEEAKNYLGGVTAAETNFVKSLIAVASRLVEDFTGKSFICKSCVDELHFAVPQQISKFRVKVRPLIELIKLEIDGVEFKDFDFDEVGIIELYYPVWATEIKIQYIGGFLTVPEQVKQAVLQIISILFRKRFVEGVATESILGHSYTWRDPAFREVIPLIQKFRDTRIEDLL